MPLTAIQPPPHSEHDVDYAADTFDLLFGAEATRAAEMNIYLPLGGGTFFYIAGLQLRLAVSESTRDNDVARGYSGLQVRAGALTACAVACM